MDQVTTIFIADNSTIELNIMNSYSQHDNIIYNKMDGNVGIAKAQNQGIKYFLRKQYDYILFMDQDSICPFNLVNSLIKDFHYLQSRNVNVGGIGPRSFNRQTGKEYKGKIDTGNRYDKYLTEVSSLISSGSLIPAKLFNEVGLMEEKLFIDAVDNEWCWRARKRQNLKFFISERIKLSHQLGEGDKKFVNINVAIATPFRTYYQYRNYFILLRRSYVPIYWKISIGIKYFFKYFYYPLLVYPRWKYFEKINKGIFHGIKNR